MRKTKNIFIKDSSYPNCIVCSSSKGANCKTCSRRILRNRENRNFRLRVRLYLSFRPIVKAREIIMMKMELQKDWRKLERKASATKRKARSRRKTKKA